MKLWIGAEIIADIVDEWRHARKAVESNINEVIEKKEYALPVDQWNCIAIIRNNEDFKERTLFFRKKKDMDFRLRIGHLEFKTASQISREQLIFQMLLRSLTILRAKQDAPGFEVILSDLRKLALSKGWIDTNEKNDQPA